MADRAKEVLIILTKHYAYDIQIYQALRRNCCHSSATFATVLFIHRNSGKQQRALLFFCSPNRRRSRISAENEALIADNLPGKTAKTARSAKHDSRPLALCT